MLLKPPIGTSTGGVHANLWMPGTGVLIGPGATSFSATASAEVLRRTPAFVAQTPVSILGKPTWRLLAVFRAKGCEFKRTSDGGCSMCGFEAHADQSVTRADMVSQTSRITDHLIEGRFEQVDLLTLGNFFNDNEYSPELRGYILEEMAKITTLGRIVVESRREYVTAEKLYLALSHLRPDQTLVYSLGYESSNERVRNQILRKGVPENYLDDCIDMSKEAGVDFSAFVMIKPPGLSEAEAIDDAVNSAVHVLEKSARKAVRTHIAFEPAFVTSYGYLNDLFTRGEYRAPWLWTILEVLEGTAAALHVDDLGGRVFVGMSDEGLAHGRVAANCGECDAQVHGAIQLFNGDQRIAALTAIDHGCRKNWMHENGIPNSRLI